MFMRETYHELTLPVVLMPFEAKKKGKNERN